MQLKSGQPNHCLLISVLMVQTFFVHTPGSCSKSLQKKGENIQPHGLRHRSNWSSGASRQQELTSKGSGDECANLRIGCSDDDCSELSIMKGRFVFACIYFVSIDFSSALRFCRQANSCLLACLCQIVRLMSWRTCRNLSPFLIKCYFPFLERLCLQSPFNLQHGPGSN